MANEMKKFTMRDKHNILILESVQNDPSIIPSMIQSLYSAISEVQKNAKTTEKEESTEETNS